MGSKKSGALDCLRYTQQIGLEPLPRRFYERLAKPAYPVPTFFKLWAFRMGRTSIQLMLDDTSRDYTYYRDKGWFQSDYYYPTRLGAL